MIDQFRAIEESSLNAWPCLQQVLFDGWLLRFARGYTRRANSVNPIYPGRLDAAPKISRCEQIYRRQQLPPIFKITPFVQPSNLDDLLAARGYQQDALTSVQWLDLATIGGPIANVVRQWSTPVDEWIEAYVRLNQVSSSNVAALGEILQNIVADTNFMILTHQQQPVSCGLAVLEGDYVGLYDIVTDPHRRKQGFGSELVLSLLAWAKQQGANKAYLQVMLSNEPGLKLYTKLGFREIYQYWYRVSNEA